MQSSTARDEILDRVFSITDEQFEQLSKIIVEEIEQPANIELTPFGSDGGIDVRGNFGRELLEPKFGVQSKKFNSNITSPAMRNFVGALRDHRYQYGVFITTSGYSSGAVDVAENQLEIPITLVDNDYLTNLMLEYELGVIKDTPDDYELDPDFWKIFDRTTSDDPIPTEEVPQADSLSVLRYALEAIDRGYRYKPEITDYMERKTGDDWTGRQADYYPAAGYALGLVHKDTMGQYNNRQMRRWSLTREGQEYMELLESGQDDAGKEYLAKRIEEMEIVQRIIPEIRDTGTIPHSRLKELIEEKSMLNQTTADRRASTIGQWINELPYIDRKGRSASLRYEYVPKRLDDF